MTKEGAIQLIRNAITNCIMRLQSNQENLNNFGISRKDERNILHELLKARCYIFRKLIYTESKKSIYFALTNSSEFNLLKEQEKSYICKLLNI